MRGTLTYRAWKREGGIVYTLCENTNVGDAVFSSPNIDSGNVVDAIEAGSITVDGQVYARSSSNDIDAPMWRPIITPAEMLDLTRIEYADTDKLVPLIREVEMRIKEILGDDLFIHIVSNPPDSTYDTLLNGGVYSTANGRRSFEGLKTAASYYAFAKAVKSDIVPTRYGNADKRSDFSNHSVLTERQKLTRETLEIADKHFQDCLDYIFTATDWISPCPCKPAVRFVSPHSLRIKIIGE